MKHKILLTLLIGFCYNASAQEVGTVEPAKVEKNRNKEIGIFGQQTLGSSNTNAISMVGVHFKKWHNEHFGFRVIGALGGYNSHNGSYTNSNFANADDTLVDKFNEMNVPAMAILGAGVEAQRTFYKRVVLFAAIELRGGYGKGEQRDITYTRSTKDNYYDYRITSQRDASILFVEMSPIIGAKLQFKKINFGVEFSGMSMKYFSQNIQNAPNGNYSIADFTMGDVYNRAFISYNF